MDWRHAEKMGVIDPDEGMIWNLIFLQYFIKPKYSVWPSRCFFSSFFNCFPSFFFTLFSYPFCAQWHWSPSHCSLTHSKGIRQEGKRGEEVMTMRRRRKADGPGKKLLCCPQTESYGAKMMDALLLISSVGWETPLSPLTIFFVSMCV